MSEDPQIYDADVVGESHDDGEGDETASSENRALTSVSLAAPAIQLPQRSREELEAFKATLKAANRDMTDAQFTVFMAAANHLGLDPIARQVVPILMSGRMTVQTTIDGFRLIAERTRKYRGQVGPLWCGPDGEWREVWLEDGPPAAAKVGVLRADFAKPMWGVARTKSYAKGGLWNTMPDVMIAKCFDESTEVLTTHGFQRFAEVTGRVLQVTENGLDATDAKPFSQRYDGGMVTLDSDDLNFSVTPNHDMVTTAGKIEAGALYAQARSRALFWIPRLVQGSCVADSSISRDELVLTAAYLADGCDLAAGSAFRIEVSRPRKIAALRALAIPCEERERKAAGVVAHTATRDIVTRFDKIRFRYDWRHVAWLCDKGKRVRPERLLSLSREQARIFVDALIEFDGHVNESGVRRFYTSRTDHLALFELACVIAGYSVSRLSSRTSDISATPNFVVTVSRRDEIPVRRWGRDYHNLDSTRTGTRKHTGLTITPNDSGGVWCVTVPSGVIVVRRNGFSMLCGNCAESLALRKAFPNELSGAYTAEELDQAIEAGEADATPQTTYVQPQRGQMGASHTRTSAPPPLSTQRRSQGPKAVPLSQPSPAASSAASSADLPTWGALGNEASKLGLDQTEWQRQITTLTGKTRMTDPATGQVISIAAQLTDDDKRTMMAWLEKRRQQFEQADEATPDLASLAYAGN